MTVDPSARDYFVTGATGFIGRHLALTLLARTGTLYLLVRPGSRARLDRLLERWDAPDGRIVPVFGDLAQPRLGLCDADLSRLEGRIGHLFHVAGLYDMRADARDLELVNVEGTRHAVELAKDLGAGCFHHVSSIASAGHFPGVFREDMFEQAVGLEDPYFRTKHDSETVVRESCAVPWRIYRPAIVVGHSQTGEMDKVDGPYFFFPLLESLGARLPSWLPLPGFAGGELNIVPVDFVARALDHIAHRPQLDGRTFHLVDPNPSSAGEVISLFARLAGSPDFGLRIPSSEPLMAPALRLLAKDPAGLTNATIGRYLGVPPRVLDYVVAGTRFDCRNTREALSDSDIAVPPLADYAPSLWRYWEQHLNLDPRHPRGLSRVIRGKRVLITGASSGIGRATAVKLAAAGARVVAVARSRDRLEDLRAHIEKQGGVCEVHAVDLTDPDAVARLERTVVASLGGIDVLINNAGRSIRRSLALSCDRIHDFERTMEINYFAALRLILAFLPGMRRQKSGHILNVSSIGTQVPPPRFSAYVASKAALDAFSRCAAPELLGEGIEVTTVYMPLVKTEMIAPTRLYDSLSALTPSQAADMICQAVMKRPKQVTTSLGTIGQIAAATAPAAFDVGLHIAYRLFPDSAAARGETPRGEEEKPSSLARVFARLLPGVHW
jgi:short-subunit dehydrogenase